VTLKANLDFVMRDDAPPDTALDLAVRLMMERFNLTSVAVKVYQPRRPRPRGRRIKWTDERKRELWAMVDPVMKTRNLKKQPAIDALKKELAQQFGITPSTARRLLYPETPRRKRTVIDTIHASKTVSKTAPASLIKKLCAPPVD
jgi:hypothetical protein